MTIRKGFFYGAKFGSFGGDGDVVWLCGYVNGGGGREIGKCFRTAVVFTHRNPPLLSQGPNQTTDTLS